MIGRMIGTAVTASLLRGVTGRFGGLAGMVAGAALSSRRTRGAALAGMVALTAYELWKKRNAPTGAPPTPQVGGAAKPAPAIRPDAAA
jgi:uncharacterized membrane protein YebE (DUF533 family)